MAVTVISVVYLLLALFSSRVHAIDKFYFMTYKCNIDGGSYDLNSTYQRNLVTLMSSLSANASSSKVGFAMGTVGAGTSDQVWGLALCRGGDTNGTNCKSCLDPVPAVAFHNCSGFRSVSVYYDRCRLSYSGKDFLTSPNNVAAEVIFSGNKEVNITAGADPGRYVGLAADLIGNLSDWAANNSTSMYAAGVMTMNSDDWFPTTRSSVVGKIYGLVQCTPNQPPEACKGCLDQLKNQMPAMFTGTDAAQVNAVWCNLRYDIYPFYQSSPVVNLVAERPEPQSPDARRNGRGSEDAATVIAIVLGVVVAILASLFIISFWRKAQSKQYVEEDGGKAGSLLFDLTTLKRATGNFAEENKLGHGGFGAVYKGFLSDGQQIAVKRLDKDSGQGLKELRNELLTVAKLRHNNLAKLLGVCLKGKEKLLVYEYLPNRSLDTFLFAAENRELDWDTRYRIIYGTARGLLYLHEDSQIKIIHRDLKASNVLLDADMNPKISDFGLARLFTGDKTATITSNVVGTLGYMAPEYAVLGHLSVKLDVYSFGVLVLEIIAGRRNTDSCFESEADESGTLLSYAWDQWSKGTPLEFMDPALDCQAPESEVVKCVHLGLLCVQENPADRPTMLDVLVMLHGHASTFPAPSKPAFAFAFSELNFAGSDAVSGVQRATAATPSVNMISISDLTPR